MEKKRSRLLALVLSLVLLASLWAFTPGALADDVTLSIVLNQTWNKPNFEPAVRKFEEANPGIKIDIQIIPDAQFDEVLLSKLQTSEAPDLVHYGLSQMFQKYDMPNNLMDLSDRPWVKDLLNPAPLTIDGKIYLLPCNSIGAPSGVVYNKKIFDRLGLAIPTTYDEFIAVCEAIKAAGITPIAMQGKDTWTIGMFLVHVFPNAIAETLAETINNLNFNKAKFADIPELARCLDVLKELVDKGYINADFLSTTVDMGYTMLLEEKAAMCVSGSFVNSDLYAKDNTAEFYIFPFPIVDNAKLTAGNLRAFGAFKATKHPEECLKFIDFMAEAEALAMNNVDWGTVPATEAAKIELPYWTQDVMDNYVNAGKVPLSQFGIGMYIGVGELSTLTTEMLMGAMTSQEVLEAFDEYFAKTSKEKGIEGW